METCIHSSFGTLIPPLASRGHDCNMRNMGFWRTPAHREYFCVILCKKSKNAEVAKISKIRFRGNLKKCLKKNYCGIQLSSAQSQNVKSRQVRVKQVFLQGLWQLSYFALGTTNVGWSRRFAAVGKVSNFEGK